MDIPRDYNAAEDLIGRNLEAGRGGKTAFVDDAGSYTYAQLAERVDRAANAIRALGIEREQRIAIAMLDGCDWPAVFLGAIKAGIVPVAMNTLLTPSDYQYQLRDSRARALFVSEPLLKSFEPIRNKCPDLKHVVVAGKQLSDMLAAAPAKAAAAQTTSDDVCFWLYSSGSTGAPKGTVHLHSHLILTADTYAKQVLGIRESDVVFSAAKLFFAYGLGNALTFPMSVGATAVLMAERPTPDSVFKRLVEKKPTIFYGVPTLYAALLASPAFPKREQLALRTCVSAGEALPPDIARRFKERTGLEILDGIGSTEMLHIFLSNRPGEVRFGTTGKSVPGYQLRLVDDQGNVVTKPGELGELQIGGPTAAIMYWNQREKTKNTFQGPWTRSGDKYSVDEQGYYVYGGRADDMLKVSGIWVSPVEVEAALISHEAVLEAAVVGAEDRDKLVKPKAYVVLKPGQTASESLTTALQQHVKDKLAPYKYPRWIEFRDELPKTATGKIQRFKLRS
ncbi:MAG: 4-hydroxybenzoate--CoA ligase [Betaproteobacteria bacterium RIFCSPHIGHO2_12_FULL_69_13]|nr:MAG: 4-hydroxybenzoate--CoA ligase [Betaproteobacteria bacterium RIFCSPHIGHO2_12_FULL_69_13]OGA69479.1 MAG: 4-hydroxybenzoate--CoA ligase [Betaproteobacteria bacterium RIFCSPLOWO2_12_FULL_68_20]